MVERHPPDPKDRTALDTILDEILTDAYGVDEQLWAFRQAFEDNIELLADTVVTGPCP